MFLEKSHVNGAGQVIYDAFPNNLRKLFSGDIIYLDLREACDYNLEVAQYDQDPVVIFIINDNLASGEISEKIIT